MRIRHFALAFSAAVLLLIGASSLFGQAVGAGRASNNGGKITITGKVYLPDGSPAAGIRVTIGTSVTSDSTITSPDGVYYFGGIDLGSVTVSAQVQGLAAQSESRTIYPDTSATTIYFSPIFLREPQQKKGDFYSANPMFKDVPTEALDKYKLAFEKMDKDDWAGALPFLDAAVAAYPKFAIAWYQKGLGLFKAAKYADALAAFVKAIEAKPDYVDAKYYFGVTHFMQKDFPVVEAVMRDVIQQKNDMASAHMYLGISLISAKKEDEAEKELKMAISMKGGEHLSLAHRFLGGIYMSKKRNAEAAAELQKFLELSPKASDADKIKAMIADLKKQG